MKRTPFALLAAAVSVTLAQGTPTLPVLGKNETVTITFYNYNLASAGLGAEGTRQLLSEFAAQHPNIKVEGVGVPSDQIIARLQADTVAGRAPDLAQLVFSDLDFIVNGLGVKPLESVVPARELGAHLVGMHPKGLELGRLDRKTYGLAYTFSTPVLFYNATLFKQAGLDPDKPPRTWDDVKRAALAIKNKTGKMGFFPGVYGAFDWMFQSLVLSNGGRVLSEDRKRLGLADPATVGAVKMLRDLVESGAHPNVGPADAQSAMASGNLGMYLQTSALQSFLLTSSKDKFDLRAAAMPAFRGKPARPTNSGSALFLLAKDPKKQRAAWELMKFLTSKRGYTIITSKIGYLPLRAEIVNDPQYLKGWADENPLVKPNLGQLNRLTPWTSMPGPNYRQIVKIEMDALEQAVFGRGDVEAVLKDAQERATKLLPR